VGTLRVKGIEFFAVGDSRNRINYEFLSINDFCDISERNRLTQLRCYGDNIENTDKECENECEDGVCKKGNYLIPEFCNFDSPFACLDSAKVVLKGQDLSVSVMLRSGYGSDIILSQVVNNMKGAFSCSGGTTMTVRTLNGENVELPHSFFSNEETFIFTWNCLDIMPSVQVGDRVNISVSLNYNDALTYKPKMATGNIGAIVIEEQQSTCGDEIVDYGENCDSSNLGFSQRLTVNLSTVLGENRNATVVFNVDFNQESNLIELLGSNTASKTIVLRFDGEVKTFGESEAKTLRGFNIYVEDIQFVSSGPSAVRAFIEIRYGEMDECSDIGSELYGNLYCDSQCKLNGCLYNSTIPNYDEFTLRVDEIRTGEGDDAEVVFFDITNNRQYVADADGGEFINVGDTLKEVIDGIEHTITLADATPGYEKIYFDDLGPFSEDDEFVVRLSSSSVTLGDYPLPFMTSDGYPNTLFIVGKKGAVEDVIGVTDIVASLQRYAGANHLPMGLVKFDVDVSENDLYNRNVIIVGGICANTATAAMYGNPLDCAAYDTHGVGHIKLIRNKNSDKVVLLVHGYTALDTTMATRVLADWEDFKDAFDDSDSLCITGTLSSINVKSC
jgi:hypothetical protein